MRMIEVTVLGIVFAALSSMGIKAIQIEQASSDVTACKARIAKLAEGVVKYEDTQGYLPPVRVINYGLPGWNLRILPYIEQTAVHEGLIRLLIYSPQLASSRTDYTPIDNLLKDVVTFRCAERQPNSVVKTLGDRLSGVTTDYATPFIWTNHKERWLTAMFSTHYKMESPLMMYELNLSNNTWRSTRQSEEWGEGKSNTLLISEKYIPDWAVVEDSEFANHFNGGMYRDISGRPTSHVAPTYTNSVIQQSAAQCYMGSTKPIVQDDEHPFVQGQFTHKTPRTHFANELDGQSKDWRGDYAWGSVHTGVITAAMGDGSVRSLDKNMSGSVFYNLTAACITPAPSKEECDLSEEEFRAQIMQMNEEQLMNEEDL